MTSLLKYLNYTAIFFTDGEKFRALLREHRKAKSKAETLNGFNQQFPFKEDRSSGFITREYNSVNDYIGHQASKLTVVQEDLDKVLELSKASFKKEFSNLPFPRGATILCLGARLGTEVEALRERGYLAIGIDISIPPNNTFSHYGDFHNIPYPDGVFDGVYTNTLDHILKPEKIFNEVSRVLKPGGVFFPRILRGLEEGYNLTGSYESFVWKKREDLLNLISSFGFTQTKHDDVDENWKLYYFKSNKA